MGTKGDERGWDRYFAMGKIDIGFTRNMTVRSSQEAGCDIRWDSIYFVTLNLIELRKWMVEMSYIIQLKYTIEGVSKILVPRDQIYFPRRSRGK